MNTDIVMAWYVEKDNREDNIHIRNIFIYTLSWTNSQLDEQVCIIPADKFEILESKTFGTNI